MDPQEITEELGHPGARNLLDSATLLRLAYNGSDGEDRVTEFERQVRSMYDQMARISTEPVWARFFDFGAGRMPSFLTKLAGNA